MMSPSIAKTADQEADAPPFTPIHPSLPASAPILTDIEAQRPDLHDAIHTAPASAVLTEVISPHAPPPIPVEEEDKGHGAKFRSAEAALDIPKNNMPLVMAALSTTMFLAALDSTIVTTALPTISADLKGNGSDYAWVGISYMLTSSSLIPIWGKLSDVIGRKAVLYPNILIFLLGSGLCGAAKTMNQLIIYRAIQGIGGGSVMVMINVIISDVVTLEKRGTYGSIIGGMWGVASVMGPLLGGVFTQKVSWRWCFWINLPTGGVACLLLFFFLNLNPTKKLTLRQFCATFDFLGIFLLMAGTGTLLGGFSTATDSGWSAASVIVLIVIGVVLIGCAVVVEFREKKRQPVLPPRLLTNRTTAIIFWILLCHGIAFLCVNYYLPVYYQGIFGVSPLRSGVLLLPVAIGGSFTTILGGPVITYLQRVRPSFWVGLGGMTVGGIGMLFLNEFTPLAQQMGITLVIGFFMGILHQPPLIMAQSAMPLKEMGSTTGAIMLFKLLSGTLGTAIGGTILGTQLRRRLSLISGYDTSAISESILKGDYTNLQTIQPAALKAEVLGALAGSLRTIWIVLLPLIGSGFLASLFLRHYTLSRKYNVPAKAKTDELAPGAASEDSNVETNEKKELDGSAAPSIKTLTGSTVDEGKDRVGEDQK